MPGCRTGSRTSRLMLLLWTWRRPHRDNNNWWHPSKFAPVSLRDFILYLSHCSKLAWHPVRDVCTTPCENTSLGSRRASNVYILLHKCRSCAQNRSDVTHKRKLQLFSAVRFLYFAAINISGPMPKATNGNWHVFIMKDRFSKLTLGIPIAKISSMKVTKNILEELGHAL